MWPFSKKKQKTEDDILDNAFIVSAEINDRFLSAFKDEKGRAHIDSILCALGSLGGYSCQASVRKILIENKGMSEKEAFIIVRTNDNKKYYYGDNINYYLVESKYSIWSIAGGAVQELGAKLIDINEVFKYTASTIGTENFGKLRLPEGHNTSDTPYNYVNNLWESLLPLLEYNCKPSEWPTVFGLSIRSMIKLGKDAIDPTLALMIVMESAVPMSKIDLHK